MKNLILVSLFVFALISNSQAAWVKAVSCNQDAVVIDRDSSQSVTQYQLVIRDGNILKRFNLLTQSRGLAQNGEFAIRNGQLIEPLIPRPPHDDLFAVYYSKNGISPVVGGKNFDLTLELYRGGGVRIDIAHTEYSTSNHDNLWNLSGCVFYPLN